MLSEQIESFIVPLETLYKDTKLMPIAWVSVDPNAQTGYGTQTREVVGRLTQMGYDITCLRGGGKMDWSPTSDLILTLSNDEQVTIKTLPTIGQSNGMDQWVEYKKKFKFDLVITLWDSFIIKDYTRYEETVEGIHHIPIDSPFTRKMYEMLKDANLLLAMSKYGYEQLAKWFPIHKIWYLPHGIDTTVYKPYSNEDRVALRKRKGLKEDDTVFISVVANAGIRKRIPVLLRIFSAIIKQDPNAYLFLFTNYSVPYYVGYDIIGLIEDYGLVDNVFLPESDTFRQPYSIKRMVELYNMSDCYISTSQGEGFGLPCLFPNEKIILRGSIKSIKDILIGERVLTHTGKFKKVIEVMNREYKGEMIEIRVYGHNKPIYLTPEHPVYSFTRPYKGKNGIDWINQTPTWISAENLNKGDCTIMSIPLKDEDESVNILDLYSFDKTLLIDDDYVYYKMGFSPVDGSTIKYKRYIEKNEHLAKILGIYIADGSTTKQFGSIEISLGMRNKSLVKEIIDSLRVIFGNNNSISSTELPEKHKIRINCSGKIISKFFSNLCGMGALNKKIPEWALYGDKKFLSILIDYFQKCDGSKKDEVFYFFTSSEYLAYQLKLALLRLDKHPTLQVSNRKDKKNTEYILRYAPRENEDGVIHSNKSWKLKNKNNMAYLIKSVNKINYEGKVFNIEVEDDNSYATTAFIVHNCVEAMSCGLPALVPDNSSMPELLNYGKNGWLVENVPSHVSQDDMFGIPTRQKYPLPDEYLFRKQILYVIKHKGKRLEKGRNARQFIIENYDWTKIIPQWELLLANQMEKIKMKNEIKTEFRKQLVTQN